MSNNLNQISVLILAGGKSSRMGADKALIEVNDRPLLQRVCQVATKVSTCVYILTPWVERYQSIVPSMCQLLQESQPHEGPLVALADGLTTLDTDWILLLACDLPFLKLSVLQQWINLINQVPTSTLAVVPYRDSRWEPLCGFYRRQCDVKLKQFIQQGGRSFQQWLPQIEVRPIVVDSTQGSMLLNCNTPEELQTIRHLNSEK
ncbi:MAG: molybdenum cofactor guanylyltransferase [Microcoleaceae cyanobacterium]